MLPDPLKTNLGVAIESSHDWKQGRREEILELFQKHVYGRTPEQVQKLSFDVFDEDFHALGGKAVRKQITIKVTVGKNELCFDLLIFLPSEAKSHPVPVINLLNFKGNHSIHADPSIALPRSYCKSDILPEDNLRGSKASRFPIEQIIANGYGIATAYYEDITPDDQDKFRNGVHSLFNSPCNQSVNEWGAVGTWAWGLSRIMDYFETDILIDHTKVVLAGHSRLGKSALWAGSQDDRFSLVISNDSGCTGAAISRGKQGETVKAINQQFPHWFCEKYKSYNDKEHNLPIDQHMLLALIAPRPVYVSSASQDLWADPIAEFKSCIHAEPVYRLFKLKGLETTVMPRSNHPMLQGHIGYHLRDGGHDLTQYDWKCFMDFADLHLKGKGQQDKTLRNIRGHKN